MSLINKIATLGLSFILLTNCSPDYQRVGMLKLKGNASEYVNKRIAVKGVPDTDDGGLYLFGDIGERYSVIGIDTDCGFTGRYSSNKKAEKLAKTLEKVGVKNIDSIIMCGIFDEEEVLKVEQVLIYTKRGVNRISF